MADVVWLSVPGDIARIRQRVKRADSYCATFTRSRSKSTMEDKKPSTSDILAKIRAQKAAAAAATEGAAAPAAPPADVPPADVPPAPAAAEAVTPPVAAPKPAAAPGAKPGSTKDIMAAIRSGGAKPAAATPAATAPTPAAAPAAPAAKPAVAGGPRPSTIDMMKAIREGKTGPAAVAASSPAAKTGAPVVAPPMPAKPVLPSKGAKPVPGRRGLAGLTTVFTISALCFIVGFSVGSGFLIACGALVWALLMSPFMVAWASVAGIGGIWTLGTARFMFPNVLVEPPSRFKVGPLSDYPINTVSNKWKDQFGVWIVHTDQYEGRNLIFALTSVCTHLGCTPNWLDGEQKFKCPCHGSGFYITGVNFEGPAPRPLERAGLRIAEDGMLEVNKSVKFQEEMGQWTDPTSFVSVV
jgi:cytochrome b6-f complex iron-sulfur subunit